MFNLNRTLTTFGILVFATLTLNTSQAIPAPKKSGLESIGGSKRVKPAITSYNNATLEVKFTGIKSTKGEICAKLFNGSNGFPDAEKGATLKAARCAPILKGTAKIIFESLPYGSYAVASIHDTNGDRRLNSNFLGIPEEGIGFSNNTKVITSAPSYGDSQFLVSGAKTELQIQMQYFN